MNAQSIDEVQRPVRAAMLAEVMAGEFAGGCDSDQPMSVVHRGRH